MRCKFGDIDYDGFCAAGAITPHYLRRDGIVIDDDPVQQLSAGVLGNGAHVIGQRETARLARLGHQIGDVDAQWREIFRWLRPRRRPANWE